jgi:hypothetical protein
MPPDVRLQVSGTREAIFRALRQVQVKLGGAGAHIWVDTRDEPFPGTGGELDRFEGEVIVEMSGYASRGPALNHVREAVDQIDPERKVIVGGDINLTLLAA